MNIEKNSRLKFWYWLALPLAALSFGSPVNALEQVGANSSNLQITNPYAQTVAHNATLDTSYVPVFYSHEEYHLPETKNLPNNKLIIANNVQEAVEQQAQAQSEEELPENVRKSLEMLATLPRDEAGLKPYLAVEVDKFKDYFDEFTANFNGDLQKAADDFCARTPDDFNQERKEARNISRETILEVKKELFLALSNRFPDTVEPYGKCENDWCITRLEEIEQLTDNKEKEQALDNELTKFKSRISDYDRAKVVYDWVTENIAYNFADVGPEELESRFRNHPEQVFKNRYGICRGYSHLTELMMQVVGIPCVFVTARDHAFNAIFINGEWWLIDSTNDSNKGLLNAHLIDVSRKDAPEGYKLDERYNVISPWHNQTQISHKYFPSSQDNAENYNKKFIAAYKIHEVLGAMFRFDTETGVGEINTVFCLINNKEAICVFDVTKECIVDGELKLPDIIAARANVICIEDEKILSTIKSLHIPKNAILHPKLTAHLKNMDRIIVDPENPYYIMYTPKIWGKPGLYYRETYFLPFEKPLWVKPE